MIRSSLAAKITLVIVIVSVVGVGAAGDGLMVIFQANRSVSDHALDATRAAFAIRQRTTILNPLRARESRRALLQERFGADPRLPGHSARRVREGRLAGRGQFPWAGSSRKRVRSRRNVSMLCLTQAKSIGLVT